MSTELFARVALSRVPKVGPRSFRALLDHFGSATDALRASPRERSSAPGIGEHLARALDGDRPRREAESILDYAERHRIRILLHDEASYPRRAAQFVNAPPVLYHHGTTDLQRDRAIAIVGTRNVSAYGSRQVEKLVRELADYHPLIVSGLAYGVDIAAHRQCLRHGLPTLGVLGSGLNHIYPHQHIRTAREMAASGGGILTEYPHWLKPEREHFPARNRIVAMLADLVVVVESATSGGSIITANMASELGRKVGACPGRSGEDRSAGCNQLIKRGRAHLIESAEDIAELLRWTGGSGVQTKLFEALDPTESKIVGALKDRADGVEVDDLRYQLSLPAAQLNSLLTMLEIRGVVVALPGGRFRLAG